MAGLLACAAPEADAQAYPSKPIRLVVPFPPGGGTDTIGRLLAEKLGPALGQQMLVDNRPGAGGRIGSELVARAAPDGYTLLLGSDSTMITAPVIYAKLNYDPRRSFAPISLLATTAYMLLVHPSVPARSVAELVRLAKAQPGRLNFASTGQGSAGHFGGELMNSLAGIKMIHVPYKGSSPGLLALLQGETDIMFNNFIVSLPLIKSNRLRALAVTSPNRSSIVPELPTMSEAGVRGFEMQQFYMVVAPAGMSRDIVDRLNGEIARSLPTAEVKARVTQEGSELTLSTPDELGKSIADRIQRWAEVAKRAGIKPE
ncbi:MAG: Bug family tripartite tricarboxylate transporter substrate binding protein [Burkholderiales bacterium]